MFYLEKALNMDKKNGVFRDMSRIDLTQWVLLWAITGGRYIETIGLLFVLLKYKWYNIRIGLFISIILFLHVGIMCLLDGYAINKSVQQILLIFIYILGYSTFFKRAFTDVETLFSKYRFICGFVSVFGIVQFLYALLFGVDIFAFLASEPTIRAHSYLQEPAYLANFLTPCVLVYLASPQIIKNNKINFTLVLLTYFLTLATIAYVTIFLYLIYRLFISRYRVKFILFLVIAIAIGSNISIEKSVHDNDDYLGTMQTKVEETSSAMDYFDPIFFESLNLSSYSTLTNLWVAFHAPYRLTGTGIGTHAQNYFRTYKSNHMAYGLNSDEAYSLFSRILSEFGYIGIVLLFLFIIKLFNKSNIYNIACFFYIIALCIRGGHYTVYGFFMFSILYYLTSKKGQYR